MIFDRSSDLSGCCIVVTGATGWVGRSVLHELQKNISSSCFNDSVLAFASQPKTICSTAYSKDQNINIPIYPLNLLPSMVRDYDFLRLIHSAFLTREHVSRVGLVQYIEQNARITAQVHEALVACPGSRAVLMSSGAVTEVVGQQLDEQLLHANPYAALKYTEELCLSSVSDTLVLRIYALTGRFIRDPHLFAIGDFLTQAFSKKAIQIRSKSPVVRSYASAADIAATACRWLFSDIAPQPEPLAAVTHTVDLLTLAQRITDIYGLPEVEACIESGLPANIYSADNMPFLDILSRLGLQPTELDAQIADTALGITV